MTREEADKIELALAILRTVDWVGSEMKGRVQDAMELLLDALDSHE